MNTNIHTYVHTYIHTDRQTDVNMYVCMYIYIYREREREIVHIVSVYIGSVCIRGVCGLLDVRLRGFGGLPGGSKTSWLSHAPWNIGRGGGAWFELMRIP